MIDFELIIIHRLSFGDPGKLSRDVPPPGATFNGIFVPLGRPRECQTYGESICAIRQREQSLYRDQVRLLFEGLLDIMRLT